MATLLPADRSQALKHLPNLYRYVYTIPSTMANSTSPRYALPVRTVAGTWFQLRLAYADTTVLAQAFFFSSDAATRHSIEQIASTPELEGCFGQSNLGIIFENTDDPQDAFIYVEVDNLDLANPTGEITVEVIIQSAGSQ